ncbi:hypothetical protein EB796_013235 [Bugula neritina]|uniref:ABCC5 n=1 Tax=Bugula neritina TaxID=10212 RepID=A0A7J7JQ20_BUGNE|nr:hypothetical protein EB796_013235 [Bugula neritina]
MDQHEEVPRKLLEDSDKDLESEGENDSSKKLNYFSRAQVSKRKTKELPIVSAGILSYITTHWATQFMYDTYRRGFSKENLFDTHWTDSSEYNCQRFEGFWRDEISTYGKSKASVARAVFKMVRGKAMLATILYSFVTLVAVLGPAVSLKILTDSLSLPEGERPGKLYLLGMAAMLVVCQLVIAIIETSTKPVMMIREGCRVRAGVLSFVFKQIINKPIAGSRSVGEVINLCANDGDRLLYLCRDSVAVTGMVGCICGVVYSMFLLGPWGLLGLCCILPILSYTDSDGKTDIPSPM